MLGSLDQPSNDARYDTLPLVRRLLFDFGAQFWRQYAIALVFMAFAAGATAFSAYLIGEIINKAYIDRDTRAIAILSGVVAGIFIGKGLATYASAVILARISNRIVAENQRRVFAKLLNENVAFFAGRHTSEMVARLGAGAGAVSHALHLVITSFGRDLLTLIGLVTVMVYQDPILSLVGVIVVPPAFLVLRKLIKRVRTVGHRQFAGGARVLETLHETLHGIRLIKAYTLERPMRERMDESIREVEAASNKMARVANRASPLMETLGGIAVAIAILYAGYRVIETDAAPGEFFSFLTAFLLAYEPAKRLARLNIDLNAALVGARVMLEVLDSPATEPDEPDRPPLAISRARVVFDRVSFAYRADEPVLRGLSLTAEPEQVTALVGPSGGGKSTVLNLLLRLYEPQGGTISIDDQDVMTVARSSLRRQIAYVGQDVFLFRASIRDNIAFGRPGASEAEIVAAAQAAFAHDFIAAFPRGYDTPVGERGLQLSGGQRQRIAIAQALLKDAPIILLDEATAALDNESERHVQQAIARLCAGRTTIVIAHRLSTIMDAHQIHVVEAGQVVESGRHDELLRRSGRYASFYRLQLHEQRDEAAQPVAFRA